MKRQINKRHKIAHGYPYHLISLYVLINEQMNKDQGNLLIKAKEFDLQALTEIYDSYSTSLYGYSMRLLGDNNLAEECVAETFARFLKVLHDGKGPDNHLKAYLFRIAHNWITDHYRRNIPENIFFEDKLNVASEIHLEEMVDKRIQGDMLREALFHLTPDQRQVIMLVFIEGWKKAEVAAAIGKPIGAVKSLQHRAIKSLQRILGTEQNESQYKEIRRYVRSAS